MNMKNIFKNINNDFALIGYNQSDNNGPLVEKETSINFLSKKKLEKINKASALVQIGIDTAKAISSLMAVSLSCLAFASLFSSV